MKWCLDNSISSEVTTPVSAQDLASALISALESSTVSPATATHENRFDILLAEISVVNWKLAVNVLEKYGHEVKIAENGQFAVDARRRAGAAEVAVRHHLHGRQKSLHSQQAPIAAFTAHAMGRPRPGYLCGYRRPRH